MKYTTQVIKRYPNRKLYSTNESRYLTLKEIRDLIKQGFTVQVMDNKTKTDITQITLAQAYCDGMNPSDYTLDQLKGMIQRQPR